MPPCMTRNALGLEFGSAGRVVCGTVYGDMDLHVKDLLGSIVREGYRIPEFYLVLHGLRCQKSTRMD